MAKLWMVLGVICIATAALADDAAKPTKKMKAPVMMTAADMKWADMSAKGVQSAPLWGDMNKGPFGALIKFSAGTTMPLHTHTAELKFVVISGTLFVGPTPLRPRTWGRARTGCSLPAGSTSPVAARAPTASSSPRGTASST